MALLMEIGPGRGPRGQVFVRGVETRRSPKAVAVPKSRTITTLGPISTPSHKCHALGTPGFSPQSETTGQSEQAPMKTVIPLLDGIRNSDGMSR